MPKTNNLRLGSRGSPLAVAQAEWIASQLKKAHPDLIVEFVRITTTGDRDAASSLQSIGGKGVFVKEIEEALLQKEIDLAVHSLKDVPQQLPTGLRLGPSPLREDSREAVISRFGELVEELPRGSIIGTSSPRRLAQIKRRFKKRNYRFEPIRGNVETRIRKVREGQVDAAILALAGLKRLGLEKEANQILEWDELLPPPCQGSLGLEIRESDNHVLHLITAIKDEASDLQSRGERAFLQAIGGNCLVPLGAISRREGDQFLMEAGLWDLTGEKEIRVKESGSFEAPELVGAKLAGRLLFEGGAQLLAEMDKASAGAEPHER